VKRSLAVDLGGIELPTPVMIASGCAGTGRELSGLVDLRKVGGVVSRTITIEPEKGAPTPRVAESPAGVVWATGLQNPGIDAFVADELPRLARSNGRVIVSIAGGTLEEYVRLTGALQGRTASTFRARGYFGGNRGAASTLPPWARVELPSGELRALAARRGRGQVHELREGLILAALFNHPELLQEEAERLEAAPLILSVDGRSPV